MSLLIRSRDWRGNRCSLIISRLTGNRDERLNQGMYMQLPVVALVHKRKNNGIGSTCPNSQIDPKRVCVSFLVNRAVPFYVSVEMNMAREMSIDEKSRKVAEARKIVPHFPAHRARPIRSREPGPANGDGGFR